MKPKLFHQGLILIILPLAFEIAFIGQLSSLLNEAEREITKENVTLARINTAHHLIYLFSQAAVASHVSCFWGDKTMLAQFDRAIKSINADLKLLDSLTRDSAEASAREMRVHQTVERGILTLKKSTAIALEGEVSETLRKELEDSAKMLDEEVDRFVQFEHQQEQAGPALQSRFKQTIAGFLVFGLASNILIGIALAFYFARSTIARISVVLKNSQLLAARRELLPALGGSDEIGRLDATFHEMAEALHKTSNHRQEVMQMVSHDLRTPMTSVLLSLQMLSRGRLGALPAGAVREVSLAEYHATRLIHMVGDLLDVDRLEASKLDLDLREVDLQEQLQRACAVVQPYADRKHVDIVVGPVPAIAFADSDRLCQVLINLLARAIQVSPGGGTIDVRSCCRDDMIEVRIVDRGPRLAREALADLFERFRRKRPDEKEVEPNTALGLAVCKAIVVGHGGQIGAESDATAGNTIWFCLPGMEV